MFLSSGPEGCKVLSQTSEENFHVYLNSVQQMVSGELAGEGLQTGFSRHGLAPQRAPLDTVYPLREHLNSVQRMASGGCCEGLFPDTVCWTRLIKNLLMPLFLMGCFPVDFQEGKRPLETKSRKRPIKVGKRPIKKGKRPIKAMVLVGSSVGCLMGCFRAPQPWRKTAPLKRPTRGL